MSQREVTFRDLEIFSEVASLRSFSKAAQNLKIVQSVASETVKHLENRLQIALFDRSQRPPVLTPAGELYLVGCRELLEGNRRLEDRVQQLRDRVVGTVKVAAIYSVGLLQMDQYVREFQRRYPDAALDLRYLHPAAVAERVLAEEADIGLVSFPPRRGELCVIPWQDQELVVIVAPGHRLAMKESILVQELEGEAMVCYTPELQFRSEIDRWLRTARVTVQIAQEFDNIEHIKRSVEIGGGFSLAPLPTVRKELETGALRAVRLDDVRWTRPLAVIHHRNRALTTAGKRFLELVLQDRTAAPPTAQADDDVSGTTE